MERPLTLFFCRTKVIFAISASDRKFMLRTSKHWGQRGLCVFRGHFYEILRLQNRYFKNKTIFFFLLLNIDLCRFFVVAVLFVL